MHEPAPPTDTPVPKVYRPNALGALARVGVGLTAFVLVCLGLRAVAAPAGGSSIGGKLEYWRDHAGEYDSVFLGSSHVLRAFVPAEFDRATADLGAGTKSFNFGVQAIHLLEQRYLLGQILDQGRALKRVLFEYQWLTPQIAPEHACNPRTVYWHDAPTTVLAVERALHWGAELGDELHHLQDPARRHSIFDVLQRGLPPGQLAAEEHVEHFLTERLMIGRGKDVLKGLLSREHGQSGRYRTNHGYVSLEEDASVLVAQGEARNSYSVRRERFLANQADYHAAVDTLDAAPQAFGDAEWVDGELTRVDDFELLASIAHEVQARGVEFVLVILPSQSCNRPFEERLAAELGALVLRYNVPELTPELYNADLRYDSGHLSAEGALYFSRLLARDYARQGGRAVQVERPSGRPLEEAAQ